eukprot:jgi/Botrbrau1/3537/Bobra.341_2s0063.1
MIQMLISESGAVGSLHKFAMGFMTWISCSSSLLELGSACASGSFQSLAWACSCMKAMEAVFLVDWML